MSVSFPRQTIPLTIAISFAIISFVFAGQAGRARSIIVISFSPNLTQMIDGNGEHKIHSNFANTQRDTTNLAVMLERTCFFMIWYCGKALL